LEGGDGNRTYLYTLQPSEFVFVVGIRAGAASDSRGSAKSSYPFNEVSNCRPDLVGAVFLQ
jgi:hypothetical protein